MAGNLLPTSNRPPNPDTCNTALIFCCFNTTASSLHPCKTPVLWLNRLFKRRFTQFQNLRFPGWQSSFIAIVYIWGCRLSVIHPSIQQSIHPKQGGPDFTFPSYFIQLNREDPKAFPTKRHSPSSGRPGGPPTTETYLEHLTREASWLGPWATSSGSTQREEAAVLLLPPIFWFKLFSPCLEVLKYFPPSHWLIIEWHRNIFFFFFFSCLTWLFWFF